MRGTPTPWGRSQYSVRIARGIMEYGTASHGGYHVSAGRLPEMGPLWSGPAVDRYRMGKGWFEEDCEWARVALAFLPEFAAAWPHHSIIEIERIARGTLAMYHPEVVAAWDEWRASNA